MTSLSRRTMVESSWSEADSTLTTERVEDRADHPISPDDAPRASCVVPKVRTQRPRNDCSSDQRVPECWDQTVPVWSSSNLDARRSRISTSSTKRKRRAVDSQCSHAQNSQRFRGGGGGVAAGGGRMFGRDGTAVKRCCSEDERSECSAIGASTAHSEVRLTVAMLISPAAAPLLITSHCPHVATTKHWCEACGQLRRGSISSDIGDELARSRCISHCRMMFQNHLQFLRDTFQTRFQKTSLVSTSSS